MRVSTQLRFSAACVLAALAGRAAAQCNAVRLIDDGDPQASALHGSSAAVNGGLVALGTPNQVVSGQANSGEVCTYYNVPPFNWEIFSYMRPNDPTANAQFGSAVSVGAGFTWAVVGAPSAGGGAAYVFNRAPQTNTWIQNVKLDPSFAYGERFGQTVAINDDATLIAVGAPQRTVGGTMNAGSVPVYTRTGNTWSYETALYQDNPSLRHDGDFLGRALSASGTRVLVGVPNGDPGGRTDAGYVEVWTRNPGPAWSMDQLIAPADGQPSDLFGTSVSISGDVLAVGAPYATVNGLANCGAVYIYRYHQNNGWTLESKVVPTDNLPAMHFGNSVAISQQEMIAGTLGATQRAYVFRPAASAWYQDARIQNPDGATGDFGEVVAVEGNIAVATSPWRSRGANYSAAGGGWVLYPPAEGSDSYCSAVPVSGGTFQGCTDTCTLDGSTTCGNGQQQGPDVYYQYLAPATGMVTIDTQGSTLDTVLSVHHPYALSGTPLNTIVCNDDFAAPALWSKVTLPVTQGTLYMIRIAGYGGATGPYVLNIGNVNACYANCDGSTAAPVLNVSDFICFQQRFAAGDPWANCDGSTAPPVLNVSDYICFQQAFAAGCP
jgi:hypothetical protein